MQHSDELLEVASIVFQQVKSLGVPQWDCGVNIWNKGDTEFTYYPGSHDGKILPSPCKIPLMEHPVFRRFHESRMRGDDLFIYEKQSKEQTDHYQYMLSLPVLGDLLRSMVDAGFQFPTFQIDHLANFAYGNLIFITFEHCPEMHDVFRRFAKVFEQTYTRFLDLQKAEAQAREAQIEAALERVRSRTMAMQKSSELADVAGLIFIQVKEMGIKTWTTGFNVWSEDNNSYLDYITSPSGGFIDPYIVDTKDAEALMEIGEARKSGKEFAVLFVGGEKIEKLYRALTASAHLQFEKMLEDGIRFPSQQYEHFVFGSKVSLMFITYDPVPEWHDIFRRFGKVFEQTYTRFLDLERAEAQGLEAIKRASVDRVRAEIASMRTTNDLEKITPLIWNELTTLDVPFIRCGVFIMDEDEQQVNTYLSNPEGEAIAAFHQPYNTPGEIGEVIKSWRKKEMYTQHWDESRFIEFTKNLVQQGAITSGEKYLTENRPNDLYLHFLPFLQGMLYVGNTAALSDDALQLVQNLADAFSTAYARYEDFNKLEAAKQQVDKSLSDLKQAQSQLVQAEKMASLGELTAGIAHEIQNPLNFVNNFSELSNELIDEMQEEMDKGNNEEAKQIATDIKGNLEKINLHGKRADAIVKGMLQHSRATSGEKQPTDINALADEFLRLAYHGLRAKDKNFNATLKTAFDPAVGKVALISQDIGRVLLNLINNAFYAVNEKSKEAIKDYEPAVTVSTRLVAASENSLIRQSPPIGGRSANSFIISVKDNGKGIPQKLLDKIFQPFFTTKPTGQGTGLGLSLSYDIVKAHGGELRVETKEGEGSEFVIELPV